jgi:hypothetical protein
MDRMSMMLFGFMFLFMGYLVYCIHSLGTSKSSSSLSFVSSSTLPTIQNTIDVSQDPGRCTMNGRTAGDPLSNAYVPPIRCDSGGLFQKPLTMSIPNNSVPINIPTQHYNTEYSQIGILTKNNQDIYPIMGRRTVTSRNKWQYYTVSGGGNSLQTKLPIKVKGKNCSGEYGCDEIYSGDEVYVDGFNDNFKATVYENGLFSYLPI